MKEHTKRTIRWDEVERRRREIYYEDYFPRIFFK